MKIKYKFYNQDYEREYVGDNLKRLSKLIIEFLNKKGNIEIQKLYEIVKSFYDIELSDIDYINYINYKCGTQYDKVIDIPTNIVTTDLQSEGHGRDFSWWTQNYQRIIGAATSDFIPEKEVYTYEEIQKLIDDKLIYPVYPFGRKTDKKAYYEKCDIQYLLNYKSEEMSKDSEYFEYMLKKEIETIGKSEFLKQIKVFIINMKLNLENYDYFYCEYDDEDEYDDERDSVDSLDEKIEDIQKDLLKAYNENVKCDHIEETSIGIVIDYLRSVKDVDFLFEDIIIDHVISTISKLDYEENKELCDEIEQIAINFRYAEFCYELAANCDWINKKIMADIVVEDGNPEINYFYASNVEGADIERHKNVILNCEYTDDYILERVKTL